MQEGGTGMRGPAACIRGADTGSRAQWTRGSDLSCCKKAGPAPRGPSESLTCKARLAAWGKEDGTIHASLLLTCSKPPGPPHIHPDWLRPAHNQGRYWYQHKAG